MPARRPTPPWSRLHCRLPVAPTLAFAALLLASGLIGAVGLASSTAAAGRSPNAPDALDSLLEHLESRRESEPTQALEAGRQALEILGESPDTRREAVAHLGVSWILNSLERCDEALASAQLARERAITIDDPLLRARAALCLSRAQWCRNDYDEAMAQVDSALTLARALEHTETIIEAAHAKGVMHYSRGELDQAMEQYLGGLKLAEEHGDRRRSVNTLNNIGLIYWHTDRLMRAREYMERAIAIAEELDMPRETAAIANNLGTIANEQGASDDALLFYTRALEYAERTEDSAPLARVLNNLGNVYREKGESRRALEAHERALEIRQRESNERATARVLANLGRDMVAMGEGEAGLSKLDEALAVFQRLGARFEESTTHEALAEAYESIGRSDLALQSFRRYESISKELSSDRLNRELAERADRFENERRAQEIALLTKDRAIQELALEQQRARLQLLFLGCLILIGVALIAYLRSRARTTALKIARENEATLRRAAEELSESQERYRRLFADSSSPKLLVDPMHALILDANDSARRICGLGEASLPNIPISSAPEWIQKLSERSLMPQPADEESHLESWLDEDGDERDLRVWTSPLRLRERDVLLITMRDVTEQHRLEEERQRAEKLESIGVLAGGIAHDFNNSLAAILGNLSLARLAPDNVEKTVHLLQRAEAGVAQAKRLTEQLLAFAKGGEPVRRAVDPVPLLKDATNFAVSGSAARIEFDFPERLWPAEFDASQVTQVISSIVLNAVQAMPDGGTVVVRASHALIEASATMPLAAGPYLRIQISDSGPGIAEAIRDKIYDPYFSTKEEGSGLGLSTAYAIVSRHGGSISHRSTMGVGTTFEIYLPASPSSVPVQVDGETMEGAGLRVLVLEDELLVQEVYRGALTELGYTCEVVGKGEDVLQRYLRAKKRGESFALVIMDLTIPGGMGGKRALDELRKFDPKVRAIVASGYSDDPVMSDHRHYGFSGALVKPFTIPELARAVGKALVQNGS